MARFDLINEFTSVYVPSLPTHPTRHNCNRKASKWTLRLAPLAAIAIVIVALAAH